MLPAMMQTPNRAMLSIIGLYNWDDRIFDQMSLPDGVDPEEVKLNILMECGDLTMLYPDWNFVYNAIRYWSSKELPTWERVYQLTTLEYNPIENYDRIENETEAEAGSDERTNTGERSTSGSRAEVGSSSTKDTGTGSTTNTNKVAGFNTDTLGVQSGNDSTNTASSSATGNSVMNTQDTGTETNSGTESGSSRKNRNRASRIHGNIGVTTTQQMMEQEMEIAPKINIVEYIVNSFKRRFCILVY